MGNRILKDTRPLTVENTSDKEVKVNIYPYFVPGKGYEEDEKALQYIIIIPPNSTIHCQGWKQCRQMFCEVLEGDMCIYKKFDNRGSTIEVKNGKRSGIKPEHYTVMER